MGLVDWVKRQLTHAGRVERETEENYRCIKCSEEFDRPYENCPTCGGFVARIGGDRSER